MIKLYGLKNCDTCRRALKWFGQRDVAVDFIDVREGPVTRDDIERFVTRAGWETALNRKSATWRGLSAADKSDIDTDKAVALISAHPTLLKRPVIEVGTETLIGFDSAAEHKLSGMM